MAGKLPDYGKPDRLYDIGDLLQGYDPSDKLAFVKSWDFGAYRRYVSDGISTPRTLDIRLAQAEHDARIAEALKTFLARPTEPTLVGVMGGHSLSRLHPAYKAVAELGRYLTKRGYLLVTGVGLAQWKPLTLAPPSPMPMMRLSPEPLPPSARSRRSRRGSVIF
ncbi:hypothetical protein [Bradyrhizobium iriomotense]|uniref:Uncharacterized protein n=1 Tax=Bradyrhizobium iriomotense TaxID=441950 RepID=A0ABQ6B7A8_9BRAD|nr:hypothetical protein [Bradyrhizobium iriomotense]GLR90297.1 hypothetical protein GCM10007857_70110 [Bradyrhizobium iriomotense]